MKIQSILILASLIIFAACGDSKEKKENQTLKAEIEALKNENASLKSGELKMKTSIDEASKFLKEIENNLAAIDENKTMLAKLSSEKKDEKNVQENIRMHIATIKSLMENSKLKVLALDNTIKKLRIESADKSSEILALDKQVKSVTHDLMDRDIQIELLGENLENVEDMYESEFQKSTELYAIINRAFYIVNTSKELVKQGVVTKEGGFIGLGKVKVLNANSSSDLFTEIKKDETVDIMLNAKKAKLISNHPDGSYQFEGENGKADKLMITDQTAFWKDGNYLVIEIE